MSRMTTTPTRRPLPVLAYECDRCGACCRSFIVEADFDDAQREPLIAARGKLMDGHGRIPLQDAAWCLAAGEPCVFLTDNRCTIYATRPGVCRDFDAGSQQCQRARQTEGLRRLAPIRGAR